MDGTKPTFSRLQHPVTGEVCFYPSDYSQEDLNSALQYEAKENDVFICSYAKCGTTWLQNIAWLIIHQGADIPGKLRDYVPMLEFDGAEKTAKLTAGDGLSIIKCHLKQAWLPQHAKAKYLYITRNPKDAFVSYYYHVKGFCEHYYCPNLDFNLLFQMYIDGQVELGNYFDHVSDWYKLRDQPNVKFILYEDLKHDARGEILKIAEFLGAEYANQLLENHEALLKKIVQKSNFKTMKTESTKYHYSPRDDNMPFIRKGEVGDWKNHLSLEQAKIMDDLIREKGKEPGWSGLWDNHEGVFQ